MKLALLADTIDVTNGYGNITYEYCSALAQANIEFALLLPETERELAASMRLPWDVRCSLPPPIFRLYQRAGYRYFGAADIHGCSIVHSIFGFPYGLPGCRAARKAGIPFISGAQGTYGVLPLTQYPERWFLKHTYAAAQAITVPSRFTADLIERMAGQTYPTLRIIHNGVRYARFASPVNSDRIRSQYGNRTVLLTVGGLKPRKGQDLVIRAVAELARRGRDIVYVIVGSGKLEQNLRNLASSLGVEKHVEFVGTKTGDELVAYFHACDMYVHTPKVVNLQFEGFGIVYLEAGAAGKPSVATDAGGIRDAVIDGETGLVVPDGDVGAIAQAIDRLASDEALRSRLGNAARRYAEEHDWSRIAGQYVSLYRSLHA